MNLTKKEIKWLDEINTDRGAADATLKVAMAYHSNTVNELEKSHKELWEHIADRFGLDIVNKNYKIKNIGCQVVVTEVIDDPKN